MTTGRADVVIIGGGVAGLWARGVLDRAGWRVILLESRALGAGQTSASQGILHRGVKYALSAEAREASEMLARAQDDWRAALGLQSDRPPAIDLRDTELLATRMHLWAAGLLEKATGMGASLAMRSEVRKLTREQFPAAFRDAPGGLSLWEVDEISVSAVSLVRQLAAAVDVPILQVDERIDIDAQPTGVSIRVRGPGGEEAVITSSAVVLAAGEGNERLLTGLSAGPVMQRRPLHMVMVDGAPHPLFAHLPRPGSDKPRLTVTSARTHCGWCWYIGGDLAETGVARSGEDQIAFARRELADALGWIDLAKARWTTLRIDRAEGRDEAGRRPDGPVVRRFGPVIAVWPTKLALAPIAARLVEDQLGELGLRPGGSLSAPAWPAPPVALAPWEDPARSWS